MSSITPRSVFFISDRTGITAETLGSSLLTQFDGLPFQAHTIPFIDRKDKAEALVQKILDIHQRSSLKPLVFSTIVSAELRAVFQDIHAHCCFIDLFNTFIGPLEQELRTPSNHCVGMTHGLAAAHHYHARMDALNFALQHDDGLHPRGYPQASIILIGLSRSGKTPCSLYIAMHYGIAVANYPLTLDELPCTQLPTGLKEYKKKMVGLKIDPHKLASIRSERLPNSAYASIEQCSQECQAFDRLLTAEQIPCVSSTAQSIEELSTQILLIAGIERHPL